MATSLLNKTGATLLTTCSNMDSGTRKQSQQFRLFCNHFKKMAIGRWHMNWFLALLGQPRMSIFFSGPQWFLVECITSTYLFLDFHVASPTRPDQGNTSTIPLPICWCCWCCLSMATSQSKPAGIRFPRILHLLLYTTTNITPHCCLITPFCCLITPFFWYIVENLRYIAENPRYSMTQELVRRLYSTGILHQKAT